MQQKLFENTSKQYQSLLRKDYIKPSKFHNNAIELQVREQLSLSPCTGNSHKLEIL